MMTVGMLVDMLSYQQIRLCLCSILLVSAGMRSLFFCGTLTPTPVLENLASGL